MAKHGAPASVAKSKNLKTFLESQKRETRLMGSIERHLLLRPDEDRRTDVLHPSEIVKEDWCHRASYFALQNVPTTTPKDKPSLRLQSIFDEGHTIHHKWQTWFKEMGVLFGNWKCSQCGCISKYTDKPVCVVHQYDTAWEYKEVPLISSKHRIAGHSDGWIRGIKEDCLIEIKSVGSGTFRFEAPAMLAQANNDLETAWKSVRRPFRSHLLQGQMYLHLANLMKEEGIIPSAPDEIVFIYELKSNQDYKEFVVSYTPSLVEGILDTALDIVWAVEHGRDIACNINAANGCKKCNAYSQE